MRALTLTQPWAALVACGAKTWETRGWKPGAEGERIAIHAGKGLTPVGGKWGLTDVCMQPAFAKALMLGGYVTEGTDYPAIGKVLDECGFVIATAVVAEVVSTEAIARELAAYKMFDELAFGDYSPGRWAWKLTDVRRLDRPISTKGALGLWDLPGYVADRVPKTGVAADTHLDAAHETIERERRPRIIAGEAVDPDDVPPREDA